MLSFRSDNRTSGGDSTASTFHYETQADLLETLVSYCKAGLKSQEFCLWVVAERLAVEDAGRTLKRAVPDFDRYFANHNADFTLEISDLGRTHPATIQRGKEKLQFGIGVGILSMQERVNLIGGRLEIDSTSHGTTVRVTMPLRGEQT